MYRKSWKYKLLQNLIFESCDGSRMTKMHPRRVWIFLVHIFELNMIPKWHLAYWKHWKKKLNLEESYLMTCGCAKCLMKKVRTRLKQNIQKNFILSTLAMCFLLEKFWNILPLLAALFKTVINTLDQNIVLFLILLGGVTTRVLNISGQYTILSNVLGTKYDIVYHVLDRNKILFGCLV